MERLIEERRIDGRRVGIVESVANEEEGFLLVVDDVLVDTSGPLDHIPSDEEIHRILRSLRPA